ncbi:hypothetical protein GF345_05255 [Candidatus Woesearchaeota archaeon]|nr:hypothetical protein [Candidatus Woesearchaeota archaeon]
MADKQRIRESVYKAGKQLYKTLPILLGAILLVSIANTLIPKQVYAEVFRLSPVLNSVIGSALGSLLAGNPVTSYVLGGEFLDQGVSLVAVTAFLIAWVTVGVVQIPAEAMLLGKRFTAIRNAFAFIFAIIAAFITVAFMSVL